MNIIDKIKSIIYSKELADLELKLLEMQSAYNTLEKNRMNLYLELKEKNEYIKELESKLTATNKGANRHIIQIQKAFQSEINKLSKLINGKL